MATAASQTALRTARVPIANSNKVFRRSAAAPSTAATPRPADVALPLPKFDAIEREGLLLEHLHQVRYIARRIHQRLPAHIPLEDLVHAGVLGLMDAIKKFDRTKSVQLKSYAQFRIRGAILDSLREMDWSPRQLRRQARHIEQAHRDLSARLGRTPHELELANELELGIEELQHLRGELRGLDLVSLQAESTEGMLAEESSSQRPGHVERDPFSLCLHSEMMARVADALGGLAVKERHVITLYYLEELTMKQVGTVLGIGESRVSQIHSAAMGRVRSRLGDSMRAPPAESSLAHACNTVTEAAISPGRS